MNGKYVIRSRSDFLEYSEAAPEKRAADLSLAALAPAMSPALARARSSSPRSHRSLKCRNMPPGRHSALRMQAVQAAPTAPSQPLTPFGAGRIMVCTSSFLVGGVSLAVGRSEENGSVA